MSAYTGSVIIPSVAIYNNVEYAVTSIGDHAFSNCSSLTSVAIPEGVINIGESAFSSCRTLSSVSIPKEVTNIGSGAFRDCKLLTSITIPEGVTTMGEEVFEGCESLVSIAIPEGITAISEQMFHGCSSLTSVSLTNSLKSIEKMAFDNCSSLVAVTIPDGVTLIDKKAFSECTSLSKVTIGSGVSSIGERVFKDCYSLKSIISLIEEPFDLDEGVFTCSSSKYLEYYLGDFDFIYKNATLYVPKGTIDLYMQKEGWKKFYHIEEIDVTSIEPAKATTLRAPQHVFAADGRTVGRYENQGKGLLITRYADGSTCKKIVTPK